MADDDLPEKFDVIVIGTGMTIKAFGWERCKVSSCLSDAFSYRLLLSKAIEL